MIESSKEQALNWIVYAEGGFVDHPADPGGETKFGISKKSYPNVDIASLTEKKAKEIYAKDYWHTDGIDTLPYPLDCAVFDMGVNAGVKTAVKMLQVMTGANPDGVIGQQTLGMVALWDDTEKLTNAYLWRRAEYYASLKNEKFFLSGWINRLVKFRKYFNL